MYTNMHINNCIYTYIYRYTYTYVLPPRPTCSDEKIHKDNVYTCLYIYTYIQMLQISAKTVE